ncbi:ROK family protein [Rubritalea spongiae]|uniref:fructokinase n=1 Tax=Rubritalea spongiae TaxID=430797 RepID=A0ABW5E2E4_9BACT
MLAGIELGGTKTVVAVAGVAGEIAEQYRFASTEPEKTLDVAMDWLSQRGVVSRLGVAAFGPVSVNEAREDYGCILNTPKEGWSGFNLMGYLEAGLSGAELVLDTDVNAAVLAEVKSGAARGFENVAYITIGTGIGAGFFVDGKLLHGAVHSEFGHLRVPRHPDDSFEGVCPFHGDCLEGLASGTAIGKRWGTAGDEIPFHERAWDIEAWYLAHGIQSMLAVTNPSRVIIGGGVSQVTGFHVKVEAILREIAGGYFTVLEETKNYVVAPVLGQNAGIQGALLLAQ